MGSSSKTQRIMEPKLHLVPPMGPCISLTAPKRGSRRFVRLMGREDEDQSDHRKRRRGNGKADEPSTGSGLLGDGSLQELLKAGLRADPLSATSYRPPKIDTGVLLPRTNRSELLVDTYSPRQFFNLVGNGKVTREVLRWLIGWKSQNSSIEKPDSLIILISGPPGIGKTTLARVLASHCGFETVTIDASDVRTGKSISAVLKESMSAQSILSFVKRGGQATENPSRKSMQRQNCIILDEIDGVFQGGEGAGAISSICKLVNSESTLKDAYYNTRVSILLPIVKDDLVQRLCEVADIEKMRVPHETIEEVVEISNCDVRSSLNTLQFLHNCLPGRKNDFRQLLNSVGHKDVSSNIFELWRTIFAEDTKRAARIKERKGPEQRKKEMFERIYKLAESCDLDLAGQGCFENAATIMSHRDPTMQSLELALERHSYWAMLLDGGGMFDSIASTLKTSILAGYRLSCSVASAATKLGMPTFQRLGIEREIHENIDHQFISEVPATSVPGYISKRIRVLDYIPTLSHVVRSLDESLPEQSQTQVIASICGTMSAYGMSIVDDFSGGVEGNDTAFFPDVVSRSTIRVDDELTRVHLASPDQVKENHTRRILKHAHDIFKICQDEGGAPLSLPGLDGLDGLDAGGDNKETDAEQLSCVEIAGKPTLQEESFQRSLRMRYRFNEGHTHAVKRSMHIEEWL